MSLSIASNIVSLKAQGQARRTGDQLALYFERLSSGFRINKASDGAADLAFANRLKSDAAIAAVALRNTNDGVSITATIDAAYENITQILTRQSELANQGSNSVYTISQRSAFAAEFNALTSEIERVATVTTFNGIALLSNSSDVTIQVGLDATADSRITITGVLGTLLSLGLAASGSTPTYSVIGTTVDASVTASRNALTAVTTALDTVSSRRGLVAAFESRLNSAVNFVSTYRENLLAAESKIRDADVASDVAELVRLQVLQQAQTAILAQANQQPAVALKLLA